MLHLPAVSPQLRAGPSLGGSPARPEAGSPGGKHDAARAEPARLRPYRQAERLSWLSVVRPPDLATRTRGVGRPGNVGAVGGLATRLTRPRTRGRQARRWGLLLIAGWLVQAGLRAWLSRSQVVPLAIPDESAYLIAARVLAGGVTANFSYSTL